MRIFLPIVSAWLSIHLLCSPCYAQDAQPQTMKLEQAVELALENYPAIRAAKANKRSAEAGDVVNQVMNFGDLAPGDQIAARGTDELRAGTRVNTKPAALSK